MAELTGMRLAVAGAGVLGLCTALRMAATGATVEVWDPAPLGDNASGVAAGMIAPVGETLLDGAFTGHLDLLLSARAGWAALEILAPGLVIRRAGADFLFEGQAALSGAKILLKAADLTVSAMDPRFLSRGRPAASEVMALHSPDDWLIDAGAGLRALADAAAALGVSFVGRRLATADIASFGAVILAAGMETRRFADFAPELSCLSPIKGQLLRLDGGPADGPVLRAPDVYLVPQPGGAIVGATMEAGRDDRIVDADALRALRRKLAQWAPDLATLPGTGFAAVRAATPDGLPLVGPSSAPRLYLATGARRNGWLLAPLVSEMIVSYLSGGDGGPFAALLDPRRFGRAP